MIFPCVLKAQGVSRERFERGGETAFFSLPLFLSKSYNYFAMAFASAGEKMRKNWKSGLTVALVAIPLSLSLAIASGATPVQGILTAVWAGLVYSLFAGSNYNIVGPTGALSGILIVFSLHYGAESLPVLALLAGGIIFAAFLLRLERYLVFIPASALHGFTLGVALIIGLNQVNFALGLSDLPKHEKLSQNLLESLANIGSTSFVTLGIFVIFLAALFHMTKRMPKLPAVVALTPFGLLLGYASSQGFGFIETRTLADAYGNLSLPLLEIPRLTFEVGMIMPAVAVALVAILETMISAKIADNMTRTKYDKRREMKALAFSNIASGALGGMPATAAMARTSLNVKTGASDKMSATLSSIFVGVVAFLFLGFFQYMPLAIIASILVFIAIRMVDLKNYVRAFRMDRKNFAVMMLVALITVYEDPIIGILFGTAVMLVLFMETLSQGQFEMILNHKDRKGVEKISGDERRRTSLKSKAKACDTIVYSLKGQLAYLNAQAHVERLEKQLKGYSHIVLRFRELYFIDLDGVEAFEEIVEHIEKEGREAFLSGVNPFIENMLKLSKPYARLKREGKVFEKTTDALASLGYGTLNYKETPVSS